MELFTEMKEISIFYFLFFLIKNKFSNYKTIKNIFKKLGDSVVIVLFKKKYLLTKDLNICLKILSSNENQWSKNEFTREMNDLLGEGLVTSQGHHWHTHRKLIQPFFNPNNIKILVSKILDEAEKNLTKLESEISTSKQITLNYFFRNLIARTTAKVLFDVQSEKTICFMTDMLNAYLNYTSGGLLLTPIKKVFYKSKINKKITKFKTIIDNIIEKQKHNHNLDENFIHHLINTTMQHKKVLNEKELRDEVITMLFASYETMGESLCWVFYHLAHDKKLQEKIIQDQTLTIATSVFKETLRLFPPLWCLGRAATSNIDVNHISFNKGDNAIIPIIFLQQDPRHWTKPLQFVPERFLDKNDKNLASDNHHAWLPFGYGARSCIGKQLALMEAPALIYLFLKKFKIKRVIGQKIEHIYSLSMRSKYPLIIEIEKRSDLV